MKALSWTVVGLVLVAGCGSDSDGGDADPPTPSNPDAEVFQSEEVGFTFEYPREYVVQKERKGGVLAQVSIEPGARLNAIKVRRTASQELGPDRYLDEFQRDFAETVGEVEKREDTIGGLDVGILEFEHTVRLGGKRVRFGSSSYFFTGAGKTWQLECIADKKRRKEIAAACRAALDSVRFEDGDES